MRVETIWASATGVARTRSPRSPWMRMLRLDAANAGCHSRWSDASTASRDTLGRVGSLTRVRPMRSSTTLLSRSTWPMATCASS